MRAKKFSEWMNAGFEFKPDSSGNYLYSEHDLTTLEGAPEKVGGDFRCSGNMLTSLEGAPKEVGVNFNCIGNMLTSLEGAPKEVGENFNCSGNMLTSLEGAPESVGGIFNCRDNSLMTLEGAPESADGGFYCSDNMLTSLEGAPEKIGGNFICDEFTIPKGEWGIEGWLKVLQTGTDKAKSLILTLLSDDLLDKYFTEHPTELYVLDGHPDLKAGVLKRTGIRDMSRLGRNLKNKLI